MSVRWHQKRHSMGALTGPHGVKPPAVVTAGGRDLGLGRRRLPGARALAAWTAVVLALGLAVGGALLTGPDAGLTLAVSTLASQANAAVTGAGRWAPIGGYAFATGMAAAFNPCGFALLPAYLSLYLGASSAVGRRTPSFERALVVSGTMAGGFIALFGLAGLALTAVAAALAGLLPWVSLLVGIILTIAGGRMLAGGTMHTSAFVSLGDRLGEVAGRAGIVGYAAYGAAFALSSLGCTLPLFLTVVVTAMTAGGLSLAAIDFLLYALGMGFVVTVATLLVAFFGRALATRVGAVSRYVEPASALLLLVTGAYVVYYWLTVGGIVG